MRKGTESTDIYLCWLPDCDRSRITPLRTLDQMLSQANQPQHWGDSRANLVRLNWMVQDLRVNALRKPIVVDRDWRIIVGDTRLMAIELLGRTQVPVLAQLEIPQGQVVTDLDQLCRVCGWDDIEILTQPVGADFFGEAVTWVEFLDPLSQHHMHDEDLRHRMMQQWLSHQPQNFKFTRQWCLEPIDWWSLVQDQRTD